MNKDQVTRILNQCGFHANYGIQILQDKSLICVSNDTFSMHDLLQATGREVVRQESTAEPGRRSRLWATKDVFHVLGKNTVSCAIYRNLPRNFHCADRIDFSDLYFIYHSIFYLHFALHTIGFFMAGDRRNRKHSPGLA
jgi:hypothetical protein